MSGLAAWRVTIINSETRVFGTRSYSARTKLYILYCFQPYSIWHVAVFIVVVVVEHCCANSTTSRTNSVNYAFGKQ